MLGKTDAYAGRVAIITGGASGIGAAIAKRIAALGAQVIIADRQLELAWSVASSIRTTGGHAVAMELDVRQLDSMKRVVDDTITRWGSVHYFFNNAGIGVGGEVDTYEPCDWDDVFDVNLRGVAYGIQAVYPAMVRQRAGHIINTASVAGLMAMPGEASYCATKHAVVGLSKTLRIEAKRHNVNVSVLCPGVIRTPILNGGKFGRLNREGLTDEDLQKIWERLRPIEPDALARKVAAAVARNEAIIVVPGWWRLMWALDRLSPTLAMLLVGRGFEHARVALKARATEARAKSAEGSEAMPGPQTSVH